MARSFIRRLASKIAPRGNKGAKGNTSSQKTTLSVEALEERWTPSTISGFVYEDVNGNGIKDNNEAGISNVQLDLYDAQGQLVDTTISNAEGYYEFASDPRIAGQVKTIEQALTFLPRTTDSTEVQTINKFDPTLGTLKKVTLQYEGSLTSHIQIESLDNDSSDVTGTVSGNLTIQIGGHAPLTAAVSQSEVLTVSAYDGTMDFQGPSGFDFGEKVADGSLSNVYEAGVDDLSAFIGSGTVDVTHIGQATSSASGAGNLLTLIRSTSQGQVKVIYEYLPPTGLPDGTYTVHETQPPGYEDGLETRDNITPIPNTVGTDVIEVVVNQNQSPNNNFGEVKLASVSGHVYEDANNNGVRETGEAPIGNVNVTLTGTDDRGQSVSQTLATDAQGFYSFTGLRPGVYTVTEDVQPSGYLDGKDTVGSAGGTGGNDVLSGITLASGVNGVEYNFGELSPASISGYVYEDFNNNGVREAGEAAIGNVSITLTGTDDLGQAVSQSVATDAQGFYTFTGLRPGQYTVTESVQPAGYLDGMDTVGSVGGTAGNDVLNAIPLVSGANGFDYNFGELPEGSISGYVYEDFNNNGVREGDEAGIGNVSVTLSGTDDLGQVVSRSAVTDAQGFYSFTGLRPGQYTVTESTQPAGYQDGIDTVGSLGGTAGNDVLSAIPLGAGADGVEYNFGELPASSISGFVYVDSNNNGVREGGEAGIGNVGITLTGTDDLGHGVSQQAVTDAQGFYSFTGLRPGQYRVTESFQPSGYLDGKDTVGSAGGTASNEVLSAIPLGTKVDAVEYNFGELQPATIAGFVYLDKNDDGVRESGESGFAGTTVTLTGVDDLGQAVSHSLATGADGSYAFTNLRPGTYTITQVDHPSGYFNGKDTIGTAGGTTSKDQFSNVVLGQGGSSVENNFAEIPPAQLSGHVYHDINLSGALDSGDAVLGGVTVTLVGTDALGQSVNLTTTTNSSGFYQFQNLRAGTYRIVESQPAGYLQGATNVGSLGGTAGTDEIHLSLAAGADGTDYNFGEVTPRPLPPPDPIVVPPDPNNPFSKRRFIGSRQH